MAIYRGEGGAGDATADASNAAALADSFADAANASAGQAAASAASALAAKVAAELAETNAELAETNAETAEAAAEAVLTDAGFIVVAADLQGTDTIGTVATNIANVNAVGNNIANVNTVAGISANVTTVATNNTNVTTVATNIANVNATGTNIANVNAVGADLLEPTSEINTVAVDIANVNTVGTNIANVNTVAGISANVTTVAGVSANVTTVATNIANVNSVATNIANVNAVNANATNINTVAGISANVTTVAGISGNVTTVATNNANVTTVAGSIASVNTNATNIANINQNAANIVAIQGASANATTATTQADIATTQAAAASASAAAASAVALGNEPVRHSVRPSLLLDFANTKTLDPRITFTRASTATFYDGKTVAKAEENLFQQSQTLDNAFWSGINFTRTSNTATAPDGTTTADTLDMTVIGGYFYNTISMPLSVGTYTASIYFKASSLSSFNISFITAGFGAGSKCTYDLSAGTAGAVTNYGATTGSTASIVLAGSGWYRCILTVTVATADSYFFYLDSATTGSVFAWGAQLEQRSSVTAYTATTTAPITNYIPALQTAAAGVARFEHNPTTGESLGLEIEEQRTNLLLRSEEFDNASWTKIAGVTVSANQIVAPDGTLSGDKLIAQNNASNKLIYQSFAAGTYTATVYAKAGELGGLVLTWGASGTLFNLTTGAVRINYNTAPTASSITSVGNGWYRCSITVTLASGDSLYIGPNNNVSNGLGSGFTGDGFGGIYIWGAQLEAGTFATSYIPTVASQVTRSADSASMTGTNFSSWYRADEGTVYQNFSPIGVSATDRVSMRISDSSGSFTNDITLRNFNGSATSYAVFVNGTSQGFISLSPVSTAGSVNSIAVVYKTNDFAGAKNGNAIQTDTSGLLPVVNQLSFPSNGCNFIKKFAYYPLRLTNAELVSLSTV